MKILEKIRTFIRKFHVAPALEDENALKDTTILTKESIESSCNNTIDYTSYIRDRLRSWKCPIKKVSERIESIDWRILNVQPSRLDSLTVFLPMREWNVVSMDEAQKRRIHETEKKIVKIFDEVSYFLKEEDPDNAEKLLISSQKLLFSVENASLNSKYEYLKNRVGELRAELKRRMENRFARILDDAIGEFKVGNIARSKSFLEQIKQDIPMVNEMLQSKYNDLQNDIESWEYQQRVKLFSEELNKAEQYVNDYSFETAYKHLNEISSSVKEMDKDLKEKYNLLKSKTETTLKKEYTDKLNEIESKINSKRYVDAVGMLNGLKYRIPEEYYDFRSRFDRLNDQYISGMLDAANNQYEKDNYDDAEIVLSKVENYTSDPKYKDRIEVLSRKINNITYWGVEKKKICPKCGCKMDKHVIEKDITDKVKGGLAGGVAFAVTSFTFIPILPFIAAYEVYKTIGGDETIYKCPHCDKGK